MSKTFYVPNEAGWKATGSPDSHYARFRVEQEYDAASNTSLLNVRLEGYSKSYEYSFTHVYGTISVNEEEVISSGDTSYTMQFARDDDWRALQKNGEDAVWSVNVQHDEDGNATVPFQLGSSSGFQLSRQSYDAIWNKKTGSLELSEQRGNIRVGVNGTPRLGQLYIGVNGAPKMAELYIGVNGVPVKAV